MTAPVHSAKLASARAAPYHPEPMDNRAFFGLRSSAFGLLLLAAPGVVACGGNQALKKQVAGLETQVTSMRADQDRLEERLAALELGGPPAAHHASAAPVERVERPRLKVIHLAPDDQAAPAEPADIPSAPADAAAHRPIIRGTGDRVIKVGDGEIDEPTSREGSGTKPVAQLGKDAHGN
jgi:hypothetical protein